MIDADRWPVAANDKRCDLMKVEQACRFRTSEGYGITAKSPGFDRSQEKALADAFNDAMIPVFSNVGNSILSCTVENPYALYAKNTLRTHETRKVIFTHGYIIPKDDYARMMQEIPQRFLAVPAAALMDIQNCSENMDQVEFPGTQYGELSFEEIVSKYNLDANRYSRLLMGAYETMTSNRSLRLYTNVPVEKREQMVRELTYCIVEGLLPIMKGKVSFSSGSDTRMTISVMPAGESIKHGDLVFGVEDDAYTNINFRDELSASCFRTLATASREERKALLDNMQAWLCEVVNVEEGLTLLQICAAFVYQSGQEMTYDVAFALFRGFQNVAGKSVSIKNSNALLTELVTYMIDNDMVTTQAVSHFAQWYLMDSSDRFRRKADIALKQTSTEIHVALVEAILQVPASQNARELLNILVADIPVDHAELTDETKEQLVVRIIREDIEELADFCELAMRNYTDAQIVKLARNLLADAQDRKLNNAENAVVVRALYHMEMTNTWFNLKDYSRLDDHIEEFSAEQMDVMVNNCLNIRVNLYSSIQECVDLLMRMSAQYPAFAVSLKKLMSSGKLNAEKQLLWEHYQTRTIFTENIDGSKVSDICQKYNTFLSKDGPFESKASALWRQYVEERMVALFTSNAEQASEAAHQKQMGYLFKQGNALAASFLEEAKRMRVSKQTKENLQRKVAEVFWSLINYDHIAYGDLSVAHELMEIEMVGAKKKRGIVNGCVRIMSKQDQASSLIQVIHGSKWSEKEWHDVSHLMFIMACKLISKKYFMPWDLLLLASWTGGEEYDLNCLNEYLTSIDQWCKQKKIKIRSYSADDSILLQNDTLCKYVRRNISNETAFGEKLISELKSGSKKSSARKEEKPSQRTMPPSTGRSERDGKNAQKNKGSNPASSKTQPASGNKLVQFDNPSPSQQPEKKGIFSNLFGKRGK